MPKRLSEWELWFKNHAPSQVICLGLDRVQTVFNHLLLQIDSPVITVAGTNGKGSVVELLSHFFIHAGYRVGTYTSPHLYHLNERIRVNREPIGDEAFADHIERVVHTAQLSHTELTFFEITTLAAFSYFQAQSCEILILEVGMGGRLDAVNVIDTSVAVITSIHWDHCAYLGDSLEAIAKEKAGIARSNRPVLIGKAAQKAGLPEYLNHLGAEVELEGKDFDCTGYMSSLGSSYLATHFALASRAFEKVRGSLVPLSVLKGLPLMPGRFECVEREGVFWIFDVAHNQESAMLLAERLSLRKGQFTKIISLWHSLSDKEHEAMLKPLLSLVDTWVIPEWSLPRGASQAALHEALCAVIKPNVVLCDIDNAFEQLKGYAMSGCCIVVWGGFNIVSQLRAYIT